ncbi:hypothetical protein PIB30_045779 [Stylosanthes scabra]|uniref:Uncharacterized protein n=1 Tax=Stylosanthes scabra TaxID=79078 RepID=A0ABU6VGA0_9FABA|nr:hypothetical protein [Stylosanthes scabra]
MDPEYDLDPPDPEVDSDSFGDDVTSLIRRPSPKMRRMRISSLILTLMSPKLMHTLLTKKSRMRNPQRMMSTWKTENQRKRKMNLQRNLLPISVLVNSPSKDLSCNALFSDVAKQLTKRGHHVLHMESGSFTTLTPKEYKIEHTCCIMVFDGDVLMRTYMDTSKSASDMVKQMLLFMES